MLGQQGHVPLRISTCGGSNREIGRLLGQRGTRGRGLLGVLSYSAAVVGAFPPLIHPHARVPTPSPRPHGAPGTAVPAALDGRPSCIQSEGHAPCRGPVLQPWRTIWTPARRIAVRSCPQRSRTVPWHGPAPATGAALVVHLAVSSWPPALGQSTDLQPSLVAARPGH